MAAALISNKPEFVKLFLEQGVRLKEFVTWDTLVYLYDNMAPSCLFHSKLQKVLLEEKERTAGSKMPRIQLHHVSQVLRELLGCSTQPLYPKPKHTERPRLSIPVPHIKLNVRIQVTWWQGCMREGDTGSRNFEVQLPPSCTHSIPWWAGPRGWVCWARQALEKVVFPG